MPKAHRVFNITRNFRLKFNQACKAVDSCACEWEEYGVSIRDLTLAESINARNQQAKARGLASEVLGSNELPGLKFVPPAATKYQAPREAYEEMESPLGTRVCRWPRQSSDAYARAGYELMMRANNFCGLAQ